MKYIKACAVDTCSPMSLPIFMFCQGVLFQKDVKHREARDWLRTVESAVFGSSRDSKEGYIKNGDMDLDSINIELVESHAKVLWQPPANYLQIIETLKESMDIFRETVPGERWDSADMQKTHFRMLARLEFCKRRLLGSDSYAKITLRRLEIQRGVVRYSSHKTAIRN